jgi:large repetitive protein
VSLALAVVGALAAIAVPTASPADFDGDNGPCRETPGNAALLTCPTGYVGAPYATTIATDPDSGCYPYIWIQIVDSALPPGLSMSQTGDISGTPTDAGITNMWLWDHDLTAAMGGPSWCNRDDVSEREFSIPIDPGLAIVDTSLKAGTAGQPYSQTLTARRLQSLSPRTLGPEASVVWSVESGTLPPGITLSPAGALAGTPTANGSYQFVVKADLQNGSPPATQAYTLTVGGELAVQSPLASAGAPTGEVGIRLAKTFTASGGSGPYTWSLTSGALPAGVALDAANGTIAGTPRAAGRYQFVVTATDSQGRAASANAAIRVAARLALKTQRLAAATVARAYRATLAARGGVQPLKWRIVRGKLPAGTRISPTAGTLTGTPRHAGSFRVTVEARDALGAKSQKTLVLRVRS